MEAIGKYGIVRAVGDVFIGIIKEKKFGEPFYKFSEIVKVVPEHTWININAENFWFVKSDDIYDDLTLAVLHI